MKQFACHYALLRFRPFGVKALGLDQVEFSCTAHRGMCAVIYASGRIKLYTRYSYRKSPYRIPLGELGLLTLEQARVLHQRYRLQASQGENPKAPKVSNVDADGSHRRASG